MKLSTWAMGLAISVLTGLGLSSPATADTQVSFKGNLEGFAEVSGFPAVVVHATGRATLLGQFSYLEPHVVVSPNGSGTFQFTASNGDTIFGTVTGTATPTPTPNVLSILENATVTGGTGRFLGATGSFTVLRLYNRVSGVTSGSFEGTVSSPGAGV